MHMADALISPIVGGTMLITTAGIMTHSIQKLETENLKDKVPLLGATGAFIFAAQMINFAIPGTGASGHVSGGMLLAVLLGPYAGFLAMGAILLIQALFFADGGLLAYGCNVFNLGFYTCFIVYPLIYKPLMQKAFSRKRQIIALMVSSIAGSQLGAFSVVIQTILSGHTNMSFITFLGAMQPIHLAIGIAEGIIIGITADFVYQVNPSVLDRYSSRSPKLTIKQLIFMGMMFSLVTGGVFSLVASSQPDGLEWAVEKTSGSLEMQTEGIIYDKASALQEKFAIFPDYNFKETINPIEIGIDSEAMGTVVSGVVGSLLTFSSIVAAVLGAIGLKGRKANLQKS